ncbi:MAG: AMP-binding protein, partial [Hyphomicrobiaceae bacterium]
MSSVMSNDANLYTLLDAAFVRAGERPAIIENGRTLSYRDLRRQTAQYANALITLGVTPGDRIMVQAEKSVSGVCLYLATLKVGAV